LAGEGRVKIKCAIVLSLVHSEFKGTRPYWPANGLNRFKNGTTSAIPESASGKKSQNMVFNYKIPLFFQFKIMNNPSNLAVNKFFEEYEKAVNGVNSEFIPSHCGDSLMIAMPKGAYAFKKEEFLKMVPNRKQFFDTTGLKSSHILSLEEIRRDQHYVLIRAVWNFQFEKAPAKPFDVQVSSTYVLRKEGDSFIIVFQLDHDDIMEKITNL
jgi:hypothetical protein